MAELKSYLKKWRRPSFKRTKLTGKKKENWEQRLEMTLTECENVKNLLENRPQTPDIGNEETRRSLSLSVKAFTTQPLTNEELDTIKYVNFAAERDFRTGTRPIIPRKETINICDESFGYSLTACESDASENVSILKEFSDFVDNSFNGLAISDETTPKKTINTLLLDKVKFEDSPTVSAATSCMESTWIKKIQIP